MSAALTVKHVAELLSVNERAVYRMAKSGELPAFKVSAFYDRIAVEAGAKRILIPSENKRDVAEVPNAILTAIQWQFYDSPTKAAILAMGMG